jgi:hypothetical protein
VCVRIGSQVPLFMDLLIAKLHQVMGFGGEGEGGGGAEEGREWAVSSGCAPTASLRKKPLRSALPLTPSRARLARLLPLAPSPQACILTVPKYFTFRPGGPVTEAQHFSRLGYQMVDDAKRPGAKRLETTDEYALRVSAYLHLYAAVLGTPGGSARAPHPHPVGNGWAWLARHLNALPATRVTAAALQAFLAHAGEGAGGRASRRRGGVALGTA